MKLPEKEKAAYKAAFREMSFWEKADHIYTYYKWPIFLVVALLIVLGSTLHRNLTRKEPVLYLAFANVAVGQDLERALTEDFLAAAYPGEKKIQVYLYKDLYLSENADTLNHEYAYASRMKTLGAMEAQKMDLVILNREAYDLFSQQGYLADLPALLTEADPTLLESLRPILCTNSVTQSDNFLEWQLGEAQEHTVVTSQAENAILVNGLPLFESAGFPSEVYLALIANSPRQEASLQYLRYLLGD